MAGDIDSINHVGLVVRDLDAAAARYEAMGFLLTPVSMHKGAMTPGAPEIRYGSGNRCAIFAKNYLEIVAHVDKSRFDFGVNGFLARHEGAHIICFGCGDATSVDRRVAEAGIATSGVIPLARDVETPDGVRTARFDCVHFSRAATPEGLIQAAHHRTPEYIHQARYLGHPNRVIALSEVFLAADDPEAFTAKYEKLTGRAAGREGVKRVFTLPLAGLLSIVASRDIGEILPGSATPPAPAIAGIGVTSTDLAGIEARLDAHRIPFARTAHGLIVPAQECFGMAIAFEAA